MTELEAVLQGLSDEDAIKATRRDLRYWRNRQATMQLMEKPDGARVAFGCTVTFLMNDTERTVTIVGHDEADPATGLLSFLVPLSRALMGAEPGDTLDFANASDAVVVSIRVPEI